MGFQRQVNAYPALAIAGDFASVNPRASVLAPEGGLVCGVGGVNVGKFAWLQSDGKTVKGYGQAPVAPQGFVGRSQQALITNFFGESSVNIPEGFPVTLFNQGDFFALNEGTVAAEIGDTIYARYSDGAIFPDTAPVNGVVTGSIGSTNTGSLGSTCTASLGATFTASANVGDATKIDVTSVTGLLSIGDVVSGTGITAGTVIVSQDEGGTPGGAGTYQLDKSNTASSATCTCFGATIKVTVRTGLISIGDTVSGGAGFPTGAQIATQVSGSDGDTGVYTMTEAGTAYTASASGVTTFGNIVKTTSTTGLISVGETISGGTGFPVGATVVSQVSGTAGGAGVYELSDAGTAYVASASGVTTFGNVLKVTAVTSGSVAPGDPVSGTGVPSSAIVSSQLSGTTGGVGTYELDTVATAYAGSTTVTAMGGVATSWKAQSAAAVGELIKISRWG